MFLTRLELDLSRRSTMKALISPNLIHGAVEAAFPDQRQRTLWRIDSLWGKRYLLLLSPTEPDLEQAAKQFGVPGAVPLWETKSYQPLLERVTEGSVWQFRLTANPTKACKEKGEERGVIRAHITPAHQKKWLLERCAAHGFSLREEGFSVLESRWQRFYKGAARNFPVTILAVTYGGQLTVTDPQLFRRTLTEGLGRGKAFGMGLMTVVKGEKQK